MTTIDDGRQTIVYGPSSIVPPQRIASYRIINRIASGGMGTVYLALHEPTGRHVALKVVAARGEVDEEAVARFRREGQAVASLDHPHIVKVYEAGCVDGVLFLAMEYLNYGTLKDRLVKFKAQGERMSIHEALVIARQIAKALQHAHLKGLVHRDVKPSNIMLADGGRWVLTDFGVAFAAEGTRLTRDGGQLMGTPEYMAPERVQVAMAADANATDAMTRGYDHRSDIYSLGVVLYETLTGVEPFTGDTELVILFAQVHREPVPVQRLCPEVSQEVADLVEKALAKDPERRFQDSCDLVDSLEDALATHTNITSNQNPYRQRASRALAGINIQSKRWASLIVIVFGLLFIGLIVVWLFQPNSASLRRFSQTRSFQTVQVVFVSGESVAVRDEPDTQSRELLQLAKGEQIFVLARSDDDRWLYVSRTHPDVRGWVLASEGTVTHDLKYVPRLPMQPSKSSFYDSEK